MPNVLIIGATRGLGQSLANHYLSSGATVYGTARNDPSSEANPKIHWIKNVDIGTPDAGKTIIKAYNSSTAFDLVIISAGYFGTESFEKPDWEAQETMYRTSAIGPVFLVSALASAKLLSAGSKVIMVSSESGSIGLRHKSEGGGNYGHHASKAALNMVTKLLSLDLEEQKVAVGTVHPGFMRTEMTKGVGFDQFWDEGGAVAPDEAAESLAKWIDKEFDMSKTGQYWAPRGAADIGTADKTMGPKEKLPTPLQLPW